MNYYEQQKAEYQAKMTAWRHSDPFYDPNDWASPLDVSGIPSYQPPIKPEDEDFHDDRFSQRDRVQSNLKEFLSNPLEDSIGAELAKSAEKSGDPKLAEFVESWNDSLAEQVANEFISRNTDYYRSEKNFKAICETLCESVDAPYDTTPEELLQMGVWSVENLDACWTELKRVGEALLAPNTVRRLSEAQLQWLASVCMTGDPHSAILQYIALSLGYSNSHLFTDYEQRKIISNPKLKTLFADAVYFVFSNITLDFHPSDDFDDYLRQYVAGRLPSVSLYQSAWQEFKKDKIHGFVTSQIHRDESADISTLDSLSDEEIGDLQTRTIREFYRQQKRR